MRMMRYVAWLVFLLALNSSSLFGQRTGSELKTFEAEGIKFSYPATWTVTDQSDSEFQFEIVSRGSSPILIGIISPRKRFTEWNAFLEYEARIRSRYFQSVRARLESNSVLVEDVCLELNGRKIAGTRFKGEYKGQPATGETYAFGLGSRIIGLFYLRVDSEEVAGNELWNAILDSLSADGISNEGPRLTLRNGGVLNGKALRLVKPPYPSGGMRLSGIATVEVVIDEAGKVSSAEFVSGSPLFRREAIDAAKKSKFPPTLVCGEPIKIKGTITYTFIP